MWSLYYSSSQHENPSSFDLLREHVTILWKRISWKRAHGSIGWRADAGWSLVSLLDFVISTVCFWLNQFALLFFVIVLHTNRSLKERGEKKECHLLRGKTKTGGKISNYYVFTHQYFWQTVRPFSISHRERRYVLFDADRTLRGCAGRVGARNVLPAVPGIQ